jgi:hypothetical protein
MFYDQKLNNITYALLPFSDLSVINLKGSIKPVEDVTLSLNYGYYDRASRGTGSVSNGYSPAGGTIAYTGEQHLGDAIDATVLYDYTEDVQFGLTAGYFKAGQGIDTTESRAVSTQLIGSMKVTF